ncbi:MAG TPA: MsnO8 family LLM class oxidoreductase [Polyangia bacterium]|jgi:luciferase family oxidoreductase group 1|nr:MsnO8 family LLM class oxidoreductase [Polyangia bacterium]
MPQIKLGVLDICRLTEDRKPYEVLHESIEIAPLVEAWGYSRYWIAEHHEVDVAHSSPLVMVSLIAGVTENIRVGTAGVLLAFHPPLRVAEDVRVLECFYPGRIDLGVGSGAIPSLRAAAFRGEALPAAPPEADNPEAPERYEVPDSDRYAERVRELFKYVRGQGAVLARPRGVGRPQPWVLGSGGAVTAELAGAESASYGLALFLNRPAPPSPELLERYRARFRPSEETPEPRACLAMAGVCAETEAEAQEIARHQRNRGFRPNLVGTPAQCRETLIELAGRFKTDEFVFLDLSMRVEDRQRSYRLLAEAMNLR